MGIDVVGRDEPCCHKFGHDRVIAGDLRESCGLVIEVEPAIAHMGYVRSGLNHQGGCHRRAHRGSLLLVVFIHNPIGILDAYSKQGEQVLGQPLLAAEGAIHVSDQGPGSQSACFSPMLPSSHAICHHEEHKRFWRRRGRWHDSLRDEERVFVWPVLASYAWILLCSNVQRKDGLSRISCVLYTYRRVYIHMLRGVSIVDL